MTQAERITKLEERIAYLEGRLAALEARPAGVTIQPVTNLPSPWQQPLQRPVIWTDQTAPSVDTLPIQVMTDAEKLTVLAEFADGAR